jgi:hypothetical protein
MQLTLTGRSGSLPCTWASYALIRDNVQHFIERGSPSERFSILHGIEQAVDFGRCSVNAAQLRGEVVRALYALKRVPMRDAAVSVRTRALLTGAAERPRVRSTVRARNAGWRLPVAAPSDQNVAESGASFLNAVLALTESSADGDTVVIFCSLSSSAEATQRDAPSSPADLREARSCR